MSLLVLVTLVAVLCIYWYLTQIQPERHKVSLVRRGLGEGLLAGLNERRHQRGLPLLELDEDLAEVAENKAIHQIMTGKSEEGWEYPAEYRDMFGRSLLMEALLMGPSGAMVDRLLGVRDVWDGEWVRCGIGAAGGQSGQVAVAVILCREAWEPSPEPSGDAVFADRLA